MVVVASERTKGRKLSLFTKLAFAIGNVEEGLVLMIISITTLYYNQVLGLSLTACGTVFLIGTLIDAFSDPLVGAFSDGFRSRWGRRHPLMLMAALPMGLFFYLTYQPPENLSETQLFYWFLMAYVGMNLSKSFYMIPHASLGAELTNDYDERTSLFSFNWMFYYMGMAVLGWIAYNLIFPSTENYENGLLDPDRYRVLAISGGILMSSVVVICTLATANQIPYLHYASEQPKKDLTALVRDTYRDLWVLCHNRSFVSICVTWFVMSASGGILAMSQNFTFIYAFELTTEQVGYREVLRLPGALLVIFTSVWIVKKLDRKVAMIALTLFTVVMLAMPHTFRLLGWLPENGTTAVVAFFIVTWTISFFTFPIIPSIIDSQLGDVADEHELNTGNRSEGLIYSVRYFTYKSTRGIGGFLGGVALTLIAFPDNASVETLDASVVDGLLWLTGPLYVLFVCLGLFFALFYNIDRKRHGEIMQGLEKRRKMQSAQEVESQQL